MRTASELHDEAMRIAEEADAHRRARRHDAASAAFARALELEREAAGIAQRQPSRGILFRSAAWLALEAELPREAERLAATALASADIADGVAEELRAVMEEARVRMSGRLPPPSAESSLAVQIEGPEVGYGTAEPGLVLPRVNALTNIVYRTAERRAGEPFRRRGQPKAAIREALHPRVQVQAASVLVRVLLGGPQKAMWDENAALVEDVRACFDALMSGEEGALEERIADRRYRENFLALASTLGPDGEQVRAVGILASASGKALPTTPLVQRAATDAGGVSAPRETELVLVGELRAADETSATNTIKLVTPDAGVRTVRVSDALMEDIVRPFYGHTVRVRVMERGNKLVLVGLPERHEPTP